VVRMITNKTVKSPRIVASIATTLRAWRSWVRIL